MLPLELGDDNEDIRLAKDRINMTYGASLGLGSTLYDLALKAAAAKYIGKYTGEGAGKRGDKINAKMWNGMLKDFTIRFAPSQPPPSSGVTEAQVKKMIAETKLVP